MDHATGCNNALNSTCAVTAAAALNAIAEESISRKIIRHLCLWAVILGSCLLCHFSWKNRERAFEEVKRLKEAADKAKQAEEDKKKKGKGGAVLSQAAQIKEIHEASIIMKKDLDRKNAEYKKKEEEEKDKNTFFTRIFVYLLDKSIIFSTICDYLAVLFFPTKIAFEFLWPKILFGYEALALLNKLPIPFLKLGDLLQILYIFNLVVLVGRLLCYAYEFLEFIYLKDVADLIVRVLMISVILTFAILRQFFLFLANLYRGAYKASTPPLYLKKTLSHQSAHLCTHRPFMQKHRQYLHRL